MKSLERQILSCIFLTMLAAGAVFSSACFGAETMLQKQKNTAYARWDEIGSIAAKASLKSIEESGAVPEKGNLIVLTNSGYAEVGDTPTQGALDGLSAVTGATRGRNTLVEVHSAPWTPLWFAVYDKISGYCSYLEIDDGVEVGTGGGSQVQGTPLFKRNAVARIDAEYLYAHAEEYNTKFQEKIFGGNEFRIVTIANAVAAGAPADTVRAFEFHDHYCPGVTSGILIANYLKKHFPAGDGGYFIQSVSPWCKEDALIAILNTTHGKKGYAVYYPSDEDMAGRTTEAASADTIVYRENASAEKWEGLVIGFKWAATSCPETGNSYVDKLCSDLWYLERVKAPEEFVGVVKRFELPEGTIPTDWARPGVDPLEKLGMLK